MAELLKLGEPFRVAMLVYPGVTQLDLTGPQEVFRKVRGVEVGLYWKSLTPITSASGLQLIPTHTLEDDSPIDLLCVPGGPGQVELMEDEEVLSFLRRAAASARFITSVCTGSLLLGAARLLEGYRATTHWTSMDNLEPLGAIAVPDRVVLRPQPHHRRGRDCRHRLCAHGHRAALGRACCARCAVGCGV